MFRIGRNMFNTAAVALIFIANVSGRKYFAAFSDEEVFVPCNNTDTRRFEDVLDWSNMTFEFLDDGSVFFSGYSFITDDFGTQNNPLKIEFYKKERGRWIDTIYSIRRPDLCQSLFGEIGFWNKYMKDVSKENKKCPFFKGQTFNFNTTTEANFVFADLRLNGEYLIEILAKLGERGDVFCIKMFVELFRN